MLTATFLKLLVLKTPKEKGIIKSNLKTTPILIPEPTVEMTGGLPNAAIIN